MALATLSIDLEVRLAKMQEGLDKAGRLAEKNAEQMRAAYLRAGSAVAGLGGLIAGAFAGFSVVEFIKGNAQALDALNDVKDATGASIENISGLEQVAMRTGATLGTVSDVLIKFNKGLSEGNPNGPITQTLKSIGLSAEELRKIDPAEALRLTAVALSQYADDGNKARIIQELFGKSVKEAAPFLNDLAEAGALNAKVTAQQAEAAEVFNKQLFEMKTNVANFARDIASQLIPKLNELFKAYKQFGGLRGIFAAVTGTDEIGKLQAEAELRNADVQRASDTVARLAEALDRDKGNSLLEGRLDRARERLKTLMQQAQQTGDALRLVANNLQGSDPASYSNERDRRAKAIAPALPAKPDASGLQEQQRYENLIKKVKERLDIAQQELATGEKLTESEKLRLDVQAELATSKLSEPHKAAVRAMLERAVAAGKLREDQIEGMKLDSQEARLVAQLASGLDDQNRSLREQNEEIGLSIVQVDKLRLARLEDVAVRKEEQLAALKLLQPESALYAQMQLNIDALREQIRLRREATAKAQAIAESPTKGAEAALDDYALKVANVGNSTRDAVASSMESASSVLTDFFKTGKLNAGKFADEVITQILRITAVQPLINAGANFIGSFLGLKIPGLSALGNAFDGAGKVTGFARGDVFDKPTGFTFAGGQLGVLGEAGPEGVLPLRRGADGKLGVIAANAGGGRQVVNNYNTYNVGSGVTRSEVMAAMQTLAQSLNARMDARLAKAGIR